MLPNRLLNRSKNNFPSLIFLVGLLCLVLFPTQAAHAQGGEPPSSVPAGQTVVDDLYLSGPQVTLDGDVDGDVVALGQNITINGDVTGSLVAAGWGKISINGKVSGSVYAVAGVFEMGEESTIERSLYLLGGLVNLKEGSSIGRDFTAICLSAVLNGSVGRDTQAMIGLPSLLNFLLQRPSLLGSSSGLLNGLLQRLNRSPASTPVPVPPTLAPPSSLNFERWVAGPGAGVSGAVSKPHSAALPLLGLASRAGFGQVFSAVFPSLAKDLAPSKDAAAVDLQKVGTWAFERLREFVALLLVGLLMLWKGPLFMRNSGDRLKQSPYRSAGLGFVGYIMGFIAILVVLVLIVALGLFFSSLTLWNLAWLTWGVGLGLLLLAGALFGLAVGYFSQVVVSFVLGGLVFNKFAPDLKRKSFWSLLLGILIYILLHSIPYLGILVAFLVMIAGFGAILFILPAYQLRKAQPDAALPPAAEL